MKAQHHIVISLAAGFLAWVLFGSIPGALALFFSGVFIDLDHLFDYCYNNYGNFKIRRFFEVFESGILKRIFVFFHSWEIALLGLAVLVFFPGFRRPVIVGLLAGFAGHLALDNIFNGHSRWAYFLSYRSLHGFNGRYYYGRREYRERLKKKRRAERMSAAKHKGPEWRCK